MFYTSTSRIPALLPLGGVRQFSRIVDEALGAAAPAAEAGGPMAAWVPPCDILEEADSLRLVMELPGVAAGDVRVSLEHNRLTIRGEKRHQMESESGRVHRLERAYGVFERVFTLPATVDGDRIDARVEQGILTIRLPKIERARPREIPVREADFQPSA